jgi:hypothetical protein
MTVVVVVAAEVASTSGNILQLHTHADRRKHIRQFRYTISYCRFRHGKRSNDSHHQVLREAQLGTTVPTRRRSRRTCSRSRTRSCRCSKTC